MQTNSSFLTIGEVTFPKPNNININMMPFIIGDQNSIPKEYKHYYPFLEKCKVHNLEQGKVGYLSITESLVQKNTSQRRGGIHTEKHQCVNWGGSGGTSWGGSQGLFMASTVDNSCRVWNVHIEKTGLMGDCEHLRSSLGTGEVVKKNKLVWMTDSCPHESLPLENETYRQWFRFVTSNVDVWYEKHSTPNSLGIVPSCKIVTYSKF
jgi:hypothetical protein